MTFLELQRKIQQTRKARKGVKNRIDYFDNLTIEEEEYINMVYRKALAAANKVVKEYFKE